MKTCWQRSISRLAPHGFSSSYAIATPREVNYMLYSYMVVASRRYIDSPSKAEREARMIRDILRLPKSKLIRNLPIRPIPSGNVL